MLVSKLVVSLFAVVVAGAGAALAWQVQVSAGLIAAAPRAATPAELRALEQEVAAQSKTRDEAEARLSALLKAADTARARRAAPAGASGAATKREGSIDADELAKATTEKGHALMKEGKPQEALDPISPLIAKCSRCAPAARPASGFRAR